MNRRIGKLIQIGLFAALPFSLGATAFAQSSTGSASSVPGDTGINPLPQDNSSSLTKDQKKAGDIDQNLGNPSPNDTTSPSVGSRSDTMGTSGSSGSTLDKKSDQSGSQMSGSSGAVPGQVDTNDIQKSSGQDKGSTDLDRENQLNNDTSLDNSMKSDTDTSKSSSKKSSHKGRTVKKSRSSSSSTFESTEPSKSDTGSKMNDSSDLKDSSDINK